MATLLGSSDSVSRAPSLARCAYVEAAQYPVTGSEDQTARVWEVSSGQELARLEGHQGAVMRVAFSPDGRLAVCGDGAGRFFCWEWHGLQEGRLLGIYLAAYKVEAMHWHDHQHLPLADAGGPRHKPNFYQLKLEGG